MEIHGIQKMTLLDYPEKVACTIFTARCNFRCPFCHNASLVTHVDAAAAISEEEVFSFLAKRLVEQGLVDYVEMDIKNAPDKYGTTIGIEEYDMSNIFQSVDFLMSGDVPYEFRTTVVRQFHKREDFAAIGRWIKGAKQYYLQSFVDSGDLICPGMKGYTKEIMEQALEIVKRNIPNAKLRGV